VASRLTADQLATALERSPDAQVTMALCFLIGHYERESATPAVPRLLQLATQGDDPGVRAEAADALSHIGSGEGRDALIAAAPDICDRLLAALAAEPDLYAKAQLIGAAGEAGCSAAHSVALGLLKDESEAVRREAAIAIGLLGQGGRTELEAAREGEPESSAVLEAIDWALRELDDENRPG